jgi:hypothetical protein
MSTSTADYSHLLREAIHQARVNAPRAVNDLLSCASDAAKAVNDVTQGAAALELNPISQDERANPAYQLVLRKAGSEAPPADLGVYSLSAAGYPVHRWYSRSGWESHPDTPDGRYTGVTESEGNFKWMVSNPESRLVVLVTFLQEQAAPSPGAAG